MTALTLHVAAARSDITETRSALSSFLATDVSTILNLIESEVYVPEHRIVYQYHTSCYSRVYLSRENCAMSRIKVFYAVVPDINDPCANFI